MQKSTEIKKAQPTSNPMVDICFTLLAVASAVALIGFPGEAQAIELDTGNPDAQMSWGNTVRYNLGVRTGGRDNAIGNNVNFDEGEYRFNRGDVVTNRVDLLTELDFSYKKKFGFRLSGAAWTDFAYDDNSRTNPIYANRGSYINNVYSGYTKRYYKGPSGEILDAYGFWNFDLAGAGGNLKVGRQTVLWGEAIALTAHSVSYAQAPTDGLKALATPGADAKETALPVGQVSGTLQVTPELALAAQYYYEWQPTRIAEGGTYLGGTDFVLQGPDRFSVAPGRFLINQHLSDPKNSGDFGVSARWSPSWANGTIGAYYRMFDERNPTISLNLAQGTYRAVYPENARLYGLSYGTSVGGVSLGSELVRRERTALNSTITNGASEGARGDTWHALFNAVATLGPSKLWDQLTLTGELAYSRWDKVTSGAQYFLDCANRPLGDRGVETGCVTKDSWQTFLRASPSWVAVWPGWDVAALASLSLGLSGNSAVLGGGNKGVGSYSLGATFTYNQKHDFTIAYNDYLATHQLTPTGQIRVSNGSQIQDRGWISLTYKGSF
jgi:hypothetical protein